MRVTLTPNSGCHEIICDRIQLQTVRQVNQQIAYLKTVRDMLWGNQNVGTDNDQAATGEETTQGRLRDVPLVRTCSGGTKSRRAVVGNLPLQPATDQSNRNPQRAERANAGHVAGDSPACDGDSPLSPLDFAASVLRGGKQCWNRRSVNSRQMNMPS